jgi:hypothetical protein
LEGVGNEKAEHLKVAVDQDGGNEAEAKHFMDKKQDESRTDAQMTWFLFISAVDSSSVLIR